MAIYAVGIRCVPLSVFVDDHFGSRGGKEIVNGETAEGGDTKQEDQTIGVFADVALGFSEFLKFAAKVI